jgi:hypothetical protein
MEHICQHEELTEEFIEKFKDKLNLIDIINYQKISVEFANKLLKEGLIKITDLYKKKNKSNLVAVSKWANIPVVPIHLGSYFMNKECFKKLVKENFYGLYFFNITGSDRES